MHSILPAPPPESPQNTAALTKSPCPSYNHLNTEDIEHLGAVADKDGAVSPDVSQR